MNFISRQFSKGLTYSFLLHLIALVWLSLKIIPKAPEQRFFRTDVTLVGVMPYGMGPGMKAEKGISEKTPPEEASNKISAGKAGKPAQKSIQLPGFIPTAATEEDILKYKESAPIGEELAKISEGSLWGGGIGNERQKAGSPYGSPGISGPLAGRGVIKRDIPEYPEWAKKEGIEGEIQLDVAVSPEGRVKGDITVWKTSGYRELDNLVIKAMYKWEFEPLPKTMKQVDQQGTITFYFKLKK